MERIHLALEPAAILLAAILEPWRVVLFDIQGARRQPGLPRPKRTRDRRPGFDARAALSRPDAADMPLFAA